MLKNPHIGQKVKLSSAGFASARLESEEEFEAAMNLTIVGLRSVGNEENVVWDIQVDSPLINKYMLNQSSFIAL